MLYRELGKTGLTVSAIGLGCAQLGSSQTEYAVRVVRRALDLGVTYIDLARGYRDAEIKVGLALQASPLAGERERLVLSTKTARPTREDAWREINESLERLGTDYLDNVHLHALDSSQEIDRRLGPGGAMEALLEARERGLVRHIGCSGHHPEVLVEAVQRFPFEVILCILNLVERQALEALIPLCRDRGVAVTVMKPLATGLLPAPLALKWLLNQSISCAVPGATTIEEAAENALAGHADPTLSAEDRDRVHALRAEWAHKRCRICHRCEPCPAGVPLAITLGTDLMYDHYRTMGHAGFRAFPWSRAAVERDITGRKKVMAAIESCTRCGDCENKCPYRLPILEMLGRQLGEMRQMMGVYAEVLGG
jgi:aryl-alcohol dehydrogenase-like predicted oxidoreductase